MFSKIALASLLATSAFAIPEVTVKELPAACSSYPGYNADTGIAGPWIVQAVNTDNPAIEGFGDGDVYSVSYNPNTDRKPSMRWGQIVIDTKNDIAHRALECANDTLQAYVPTDLTDAGAPTAVQWMPVALSPNSDDGVLLWKVDGEQVKVYEHYIGEEKQPGVFLGGYDGTTTWGFKYYPAALGTYDMPYFSMRLMPGTAQLSANETKGFVKVYGS